ncbi:3-phosphoinositide dependent protein kinase-1 [Strigomonas culicis]|uniref:non-specific serine/threonine protein kinase n=2 Tax=Strigomonas culicis TaxID=28005 RepID=S9UAJ7_9TRYP|nr:3-phosphoinositide dependent protein kinase-1 [Strigomonas culicis]|eukprot:EPY25978.1 3-phosphoinositide dependent protein kinase-1 [Strigomonas culicis]
MTSNSTKMVASDFEFERQLGTGAFSKVVVGRYKPTGQRYAVKLISKRSILNAPTDEERARMADVARRESRMLLLCEHPNIVRFYQSMQTTEDLVYVTELCDGGELLDHIARLGKVPLEAARYATAELLSAVFYLHYGTKRAVGNTPAKASTLIHRDLKPENIMLSADKHVKLIDFGTAVITDSVHDKSEEKDNSQGRAQTFCGTTYYMSPELFQDNYTCCASDYWGCGCVLYHMLLGKRPFDAATQYLLIKSILEQEPEYPPDLDPDAKDLIQKLLVKSPEKRISMEDMKKHPFFAVVNFDTLSATRVEGLWVKETPWVDESSVIACQHCNKAFGMFTQKDYCRRCGLVLCEKCVSTKLSIPSYRVQEPQQICSKCAKEFTETEEQ